MWVLLFLGIQIPPYFWVFCGYSYFWVCMYLGMYSRIILEKRKPVLPPPGKGRFSYLEGGEVGPDVDGVPARVGGVGWGTLGSGHGQQIRLLVVGVVLLVVLPHQVQELLREQRAGAAPAAVQAFRPNHFRKRGVWGKGSNIPTFIPLQRQEQQQKRER